MGYSTNIYGIIAAPNKEFIWDRNMQIISSLPEEDIEFPWISRKMFNKEFQRDWDERLLHFAANYKDLEFNIRPWIDKFEKLLAELMWIYVVVHFNTEVSGKHEQNWQIDLEILNQWESDKWIATSKWTYKGDIDILINKGRG